MPYASGARRVLVFATLAPLATLATTGCAAVVDDPAASDRVSIIGGVAHAGHPAVGALAWQGGGFFCTGTLIAPRAVLTAAHCAMADLGTEFRIGTQSWAPSAAIPIVDYRVPALWDGSNFAYDIAIAELAADAPVAPIEINRAPSAVAVGTLALFIGYGQADGGGSGARRAVEMFIEWTGTAMFAYGDSGHNTCYGDSGGPALVTDGVGVERVAGVTSHGDASCNVDGVDTRVDAHQGWLDMQLADIAAAAAASAEPPPPATPVTCAAPGACGNQAPAGCWCDGACVRYGDCCGDACAACGAC